MSAFELAATASIPVPNAIPEHSVLQSYEDATGIEKNWGRYIGGLAGGAAALAETGFTPSSNSEAALLISSGLFALGAVDVAILCRSITRSRAARHEKAEEELGERYELYELPGNKKVIRWLSGEEDSGDTVDRLRLLVTQAKENKCNRVAVDPAVAGLVLPKDTKLPSNFESLSWSETLNKRMHVALKPRVKELDTVVWATPTAWMKALGMHEKSAPTMSVLIDRLANLDPYSPIVKAYRDYGNDPSMQRESTALAAVRRIESYLQTTEPYKNEALQGTVSTPQKKHTVHGISARLSIVVVDDDEKQNVANEVIWREPRGIRRQDTYAALELDNAESAEALLEDALPEDAEGRLKVQKALELKICKNLLTDDNETTQIPSPDLAENASAPVTEESVKSRQIQGALPTRERTLSLKRQRIKQTLAALAIVGAAYSVGSLPGIFSMHERTALSSSTVVSDVNSRSSNITEWSIHASDTNSLSPDEYWNQFTSSRLEDGQWVSNSIASAKTIATLPTVLLPNSGANIQVIDRQSWFDAPTDIHNTDGTTVVSIPVMDGTVPTAADIGGKPVELAVNKNGTYDLRLPEAAQRQDQLEYWVQAAPTYSRTIALGAITVTGNPSFNAQEVAALWKQYIPHPAKVRHHRSRLSEEANYINSHFTYSLTPLDGKTISDFKNWTDITRQYFQNGKAVCNLAGTELALANPTTLNVASGYHLLPNMDQTALTTHNGHVWNVTPQGSIIDSTPADTAGKYSSFFDEKAAFEQEVTPLPPASQRFIHSVGGYVLDGITVQLAGTLLWGNRRQARRAANVVRGVPAMAAKAQLTAMGPERLGFAYSAINQALFAAEGKKGRATEISSQPMRTADLLERTKTQRFLTATETATTLHNLKAGTPNPEIKANLRLAERVAKLTRRATAKPATKSQK
jgi:hypothetical protein